MDDWNETEQWSEETTIEQIWHGSLEGRQPPGRLKKIWKDQMLRDMRKIQVIESGAEDPQW